MAVATHVAIVQLSFGFTTGYVKMPRAHFYVIVDCLLDLTHSTFLVSPVPLLIFFSPLPLSGLLSFVSVSSPIHLSPSISLLFPGQRVTVRVYCPVSCSSYD